MNDFTQAIDFIGNHSGLLWHKALDQLALSGEAIGLSLAIALPLGLWLGHLHRASFLAINVPNVGRALPSLALISIGLGIFGIGTLNVVVALVVLAVPIVITNAYLAIEGADADVVAAARGIGMSGWQVFVQVELPLGMALLFAGIRTASVYVVSTATLAAVAGGGGLGDIIVNQASFRFSGVLGAALCVTALAFAIDAIFLVLQRWLTPAGLRQRLSAPDVSRASADARARPLGPSTAPARTN